MLVTCTKPEAACRQLDVAIALLFAESDALAVRTLAAAAHGVLADLVESVKPGKSWRSKALEDSGISKKDALGILNSAQNYLKHADQDPDGVLSFEEEENDHVLFLATLECGELQYPLTVSMEGFQIWFLASYPEKIGLASELTRKARLILPKFETLSRRERFVKGAELIEKAKTLKAGRKNAV